MDALLQADQELFQAINGRWTSPFMDALMPIVTDLHKNWIAVGIVLPLALAFWIWKSRTRAVKAILALALAAAVSDLVCYRAVKPLVERPRPEQSGVAVQLRVPSQGGPSFPSNHASNVASAAMMLWLLLRRWSWVGFLVSAMVSYSRVYVGVHFPLDVLSGMALGFASALTVYIALRGWLAAPGFRPAPVGGS